MRFIEREFPSMKPRFESLYVKKYPPETYRKEVKAMVQVLQKRYGLTAREDATGDRPGERSGADLIADPEQVGFSW